MEIKKYDRNKIETKPKIETHFKKSGNCIVKWYNLNPYLALRDCCTHWTVRTIGISDKCSKNFRENWPHRTSNPDLVLDKLLSKPHRWDFFEQKVFRKNTEKKKNNPLEKKIMFLTILKKLCKKMKKKQKFSYLVKIFSNIFKKVCRKKQPYWLKLFLLHIKKMCRKLEKKEFLLNEFLFFLN